ncbi:MFS transporter [Salarchaeum sp. JOR-1]|uniref:MFS transporter n=1 Tax=Salarchaeum sp. JOR-1 TaxID=2599399 RepID=UPI00143E0B20|nr:MFS transporter [Salarchaeum sp. JOR-1]
MSDTRVPWTSPQFQVIVLSSLMGVMGVSLISPALPTVREALAITDGQAALLVTAFTVPGIVLAPLVGVFADRYGRRAVLVPCLIGYGVSGAAVALTTDFTVILGLRVLQGVAGSALVTLAVTLIGDLYDAGQRNHLMGVNGAAISVGTASYPLVGGALASVSWRAPFLLYIVGVPVGLVAYRSLDDGDGRAHGLDYFRNALAAVPTRRTAALYATYVAAFVVLYGTLITAVPFLLHEAYGLGSFGTGLVLTSASAMTAVTASQNGRLSGLASNDRLVALGFVGYGVGLVGAYFAGSPVAFAVAILAFGAGQGVVQPSIDTATSSLVSAEFRGGVMSFRTTAIRTGQTLGPPLATAADAVIGYRAFLLAVGVVALAAGAVAAVLVAE